MLKAKCLIGHNASWTFLCKAWVPIYHENATPSLRFEALEHSVKHNCRDFDKVSSVAAREVILITPYAGNDEDLVKMTTFPFQGV